jgi:catechol 2,3-dioxygenase-like lactoylglutathione lyase family enzyme
MEIRSTHHVALYTTNFDQLRAFYTDIIGMPIVGGFRSHQIVFLAAGSTTIELVAVQEATGGTQGWQHLALEVADVDTAYAELVAHGVVFHELPQDFPSEQPLFRLAFFKDPDGNEIELIQPLGQRYPALEAEPHYAP